MMTFKSLALAAALGGCFFTSLSAEAKSPPVAVEPATPIYRENAFDIETGMLWQVGHFTNIDYRLVPTQLAWRTPRWFGYDFDNGATISVRHRIAALGSWVENGPESHYFGIMLSPSIEYWNAKQTWSVYIGSGGGCGLIDSQGVPGGQGQDFTLNWFAHMGLQHFINDTLTLRAGAMFQHMSNGGATDPNPGIDAVGFTLGASWKF